LAVNLGADLPACPFAYNHSMTTRPSASLPSRVAQAVRLLDADLKTIFGGRLVSLVLYGPYAVEGGEGRGPIHTLALVASLGYADLAACAARADAWDAAGLGVPLFLSPAEFASSLDAFPLEYGAIIARHVAITGDDPFAGISVRAEDRRRACEVQAKSHLIHLREGFLQAQGRPPAVGRLIRQSIDSFATLLVHLADLDGSPHHSPEALVSYAAARIGLADALVARLLALPDRPALADDEAAQLYPPYLEASERLARFVDRWKETTHA
jgi:hypothetical protein